MQKMPKNNTKVYSLQFTSKAYPLKPTPKSQRDVRKVAVGDRREPTDHYRREPWCGA